MAEDTEYLKLPTEERCVHKNWKARVSGYEQCTQLFRTIDDEKSPEWNKYLGLLKKFVTDSNVAAQEKGLEATLAFVENAAVAGKTTGDVVSGIVNKCVAAPKAKTKDLSTQIILMYIEIEKHEIVLEELLKGTEAKNPKIVSACITIISLALREFGPKVINIKPLVKKLPAFLEDRDKTVRDGGKALAVDIYRWMGAPLKQQLNNLKPVQLTELETEFNNLKQEKVVVTRYLRSQKPKSSAVGDSALSDADEDDQEENNDSGGPEVDPYEMLDPVDILSKLPGDFYEKLESKKWQERKESLECLENLLKSNPKLESGDYGDVVRVLKKTVSKDSNVLVVALAAKCIAGLATGLKKRFSIYATTLLSALLEKFKEKKQNVVLALREAVDATFLCTTIDAMLEDVTAALDSKNPSVKAETASFLARCFARTPPDHFNKKLLKAYTTPLLKTLNESDPLVRDNSAEALGTALKLVGEKTIIGYLGDADNLKMTKIKEFAEKAVIHVKVSAPKKQAKRPNTAPAKIESQSKSNDTEASKAKRPSTATAKKAPAKKAPAGTNAAKKGKPKQNDIMEEYEMDNQNDNDPMDDYSAEDDNLPRVDISGQITESLLNELADKNWKNRNEGLQKISNILSETKCIKSNIGDLPQSLALRLVDSNSKIVQSTLGICENLASAMGPAIKQHIRVLFPGILQCFGDTKNWIRAAALSCLNAWADQCGFKEFFEGEIIADALKSGSPTLRIELWMWLAQKLPNVPVKQIPKEELIACMPHLYSNLEDRNVEVRKNAQEAVLGFMIHLSFETMSRQTEKLKPGSKTVVLAILDKVRPNMPIKPLPKKAPEEVQTKTVKSGGAQKANKAIVKPKSGAKPTTGRKKDDDIDTSPLLCENILKHQRSIDEQKLKVLKWNFTTPREEFVDLLKELMAAANVNKTLMANMFHADFRYHLKAIESLTEDLPGNSKALVCNLDLILKWLTLRFFDTNPSVLLKGLDYLQLVFNMLIEDQYHLLENEASSFIPYLTLKIGDPKDAVRIGVRALFKQIAHVYPVTKLFSYVMEGLKSKNARQRTECLDQLGSLIENHGISVCHPSPVIALKEVAKQIADRDNSVRNAALNCIVQVYFLEGERVYKLIGQISEKDQSLLDERIKRAAKNRPTKTDNRSVAPTAVAPTMPDDNDMEENDYEEQEEEEEIEEREQRIETINEKITEVKEDVVTNKNNFNLNGPVNNEKNSPMQQSQTISFSGPFGLDLELLEKLERDAPVKYKIPQLMEHMFSNSNEQDTYVKQPPMYVPSGIMPISPPKPLLPKSVTSPQAMTKDGNLERSILAIISPELSTAIQALNSMENLIKSPQMILLKSKEDKVISAINMQLKLLKTYPLNQDSLEVSRGFRSAFMVLLAFYDTRVLGQNVPAVHLKDLVDQMIGLLADNKLERLNDSQAYVRVINNIAVKIIDNSNHSTITCVLINLLHDCADSNSATKYEELVMKCLWKIIKLIPNWAGELDYDSILLEVHNFFKDYPFDWWKSRHSDTPLRTIKTILHSMTKGKGSTILSHLTKIKNPEETELYRYLLRLIDQWVKVNVPYGNISSGTKTITKSHNQDHRNVSKYTHQQLCEIFKKIGSKDKEMEGLTQLYDFKLQNPDADVQPFLDKSHPYFQDFIEQKLKEIGQARNNQNSRLNTQFNIQNNIGVSRNSAARLSEEKNVIDPLHRLEKLRALEAQCRQKSDQ